VKFFHNDKVALGWAVFIELVAHGFFAMQAFLLGGFVGDLTLTKAIGPIAANWVGSVSLAILIGGAAFQTFVLGEYMKQHVEAYEMEVKDGSYRRSFKWTQWLVGGLEITSLLFRCGVVLSQGDLGQAVLVLIFGIILLFYAYVQAKVIHAVVNRPVFNDVIAAQDLAGRKIVTTALDNIPRMTVEQLQRFSSGDVSPVDEMEESNYAAKHAKIQAKEDKEQAQRERDAEKQQKVQSAKELAQKLLRRQPQQQVQQPFLKAVTGNQQVGNGQLEKSQRGLY
jgi:hypothetical protein